MSLYPCLICHVFKQRLLTVGGTESERECVSTKCSLSYVKDAIILNFHFAHSKHTSWHL